MNPVVALWVALSLLGGCTSLYLSHMSWRDLRALGDDHNGRHAVARSRLAREFLRVTVHAMYLALGLPLLFSPFNGVSFFVLALMWGNIVLVTNSLIDARTRHLLWQTRGSESEIEHRAP